MVVAGVVRQPGSRVDEGVVCTPGEVRRHRTWQAWQVEDEQAEQAESWRSGGLVMEEVRLVVRLEKVPRLSETLAPRDLHITRDLSVRSCLPPRPSPSRAYETTSMCSPQRP